MKTLLTIIFLVLSCSLLAQEFVYPVEKQCYERTDTIKAMLMNIPVDKTGFVHPFGNVVYYAEGYIIQHTDYWCRKEVTGYLLHSKDTIPEGFFIWDYRLYEWETD